MYQYFFTLSFLFDFFKKYTDDWLEGLPNEHQEAFIRFFRNHKGHVLKDCSFDEIENYPILYKIIGAIDNPNYKPWCFEQESNDTDKFYNNTECCGILAHAVGFTNTLNFNDKSKLEKDYYKPVFTSEKVEKKFSDLTKVPRLKKDTEYEWKDILNAFNLPTCSVIISDNYLITDCEKINNNLKPILDFFSNLDLKKIPIIILSSKKSNVNYKRIKTEIEQQFNRIYCNKIKVEVVFIEGGLKEEHDRRIITDCSSINIPIGLDVINNNGKCRGNSEPSIVSVFSGDSTDSDHLEHLRNRLNDAIRTGRVQFDNL